MNEILLEKLSLVSSSQILVPLPTELFTLDSNLKLSYYARFYINLFVISNLTYYSFRQDQSIWLQLRTKKLCWTGPSEKVQNDQKMLGITIAQAKRVEYSEKLCFRNIISTRLKKQMSKTL